MIRRNGRRSVACFADTDVILRLDRLLRAVVNVLYCRSRLEGARAARRARTELAAFLAEAGYAVASSLPETLEAIRERFSEEE